VELLKPGRTLFYPSALTVFRAPSGHRPELLPGEVLVTQDTMDAGSRYTVWYQPSAQRSYLNRTLTPSEVQRYTQLPSTIPESIVDLGKSLTEQSENQFEAAMAVQEYLRQNYTYTLEPPT